MQNAGSTGGLACKTPGRREPACKNVPFSGPSERHNHCNASREAWTDRLTCQIRPAHTRMWQRFAIVALLPVAACAHSVTRPGLRAPNPNGCYAIVYEHPSFGGAGDVLNGPARLPRLEQVPETNQRNWRRRIRSLRVGRAAAVTAYVETAFKGQAQQFGPGTEHPRLDPAISARIQSLELACVDGPRVPR
jgi:hypothetical protein